MKITILAFLLSFQALAFFDLFSGKQKSPGNSKLINPNVSKSDYGHHWKNEWSKRVFDQLDNPDLSNFMNNPMILNVESQKMVGCPNFLHLNPIDRKIFWAIFIASMSNREGRHKHPAYINPTDHKRANVGVSAGLLQIDSLNASGTGCRKDDGSELNFKATKGKVSTPKDEVSMKDPLLNIKCGMYLLQKELLNRGGRLMGSDSYWSILRPSGNDDEIFIRLLRKDLAQLRSCQATGSNPIIKNTEPKKINQQHRAKEHLQDFNSESESKTKTKNK